MVMPMNDPFDIPSSRHRTPSSHTAMGKVIAVLEYLATCSRTVPVSEIAKVLGLSRSQAHRIVAMLEEEDMLVRHPITKRVMFGRRFAKVACKLLAGSPLKPLWHIVLEDLVRDVGATCNIVVYEGSIGTYFDRVEANWPCSIKFKFGSKVPLYCTAGGKLYLSSLTSTERRIILDSLNLTPLTKATITDRRVLAEQLQQIGKDKIGFDCGEFIEGMIAVAVPVTDCTDAFLATLAVHAQSSSNSIDGIRPTIPRLQLAAKHLADIFESHIERRKLVNNDHA